jgi:hypothetical protein
MELDSNVILIVVVAVAVVLSMEGLKSFCKCEGFRTGQLVPSIPPGGSAMLSVKEADLDLKCGHLPASQMRACNPYASPACPLYIK